MIRFKDKVFEDYFIDPVTAVITDKYGNVQEPLIRQGYAFFKGMGVHRIQAHTAYGYKQGYDVHHIDINPLNNSLSNLAYISHSEHVKLHALGNTNCLGRKYSDEHKRNISESLKGRIFSEEHRLHISISGKGRHWFWWNNGVTQMCNKECPRRRLG